MIMQVHTSTAYTHRISGIATSADSIQWSEEDESNELQEVEILSIENIKPATPTPQHLRIYKLSILDQLNVHVYIPFVYFYSPNDDPNINKHAIMNDIVFKRRKLLKKSLSKTLTRFYPLAGKVTGADNLHVECNDDGVYYVEARVKGQLNGFLMSSQPKYSRIHQLFPFHPSSTELLSKTYLAMIQVNVFDCGGIAISLYTSHKLVDGQTHVSFMKAWAEQARLTGDDSNINVVVPHFDAPSVFLGDPTLPKDASLRAWPLQPPRTKNVTRRFVFDASGLAALKAKISSCSRISRAMAVSGLMWKCATETARTTSGSQRPSFLGALVNLRPRSCPPLSPYCFGNIYWAAIAKAIPTPINDDTNTNNTGFDLNCMIGSLRDSVARINYDFVDLMKGENGSAHIIKLLDEWKKEHYYDYDVDAADRFVVTSMCNGGIYEVDFGWGKPIWSCIACTGVDNPPLSNLICLTDTRTGGGIEAWVTLDESHMNLFQKDPQLLSFASVDIPGPLQIDN